MSLKYSKKIIKSVWQNKNEGRVAYICSGAGILDPLISQVTHLCCPLPDFMISAQPDLGRGLCLLHHHRSSLIHAVKLGECILKNFLFDE